MPRHRIRTLASVAALYAVRKRTAAFAIIRRSLRSKSFPPRFFSELLIHLSLFLGYPVMLDGLERLASLTKPRGQRRGAPVRWSRLSAKGPAVLRKVYGKQTEKLLARLEELSEGLSMRVTEDAYGAVMARPGLTLADREVINVVVLFVEGYEPQLYSHIRGALRSSVKPHAIASALEHAGRIAAKNPSRAVTLVNEIARSMKVGSF
jgi:alkylhydroperoxidase/carboxymuconolactone decarboxylase family protein YurZ